MSAEMSSTMPMPSIDIGIRPTNPAMTNPLAPGMLNSPRYGPTTTPPLSRAPGARRYEPAKPSRTGRRGGK
ncbi:hypothetical protein Skr01_27560 [Sphaerisporangium krabiense]|nr:hypothetical protein Skr01_27560 [Sphaerisporangium krabiense]